MAGLLYTPINNMTCTGTKKDSTQCTKNERAGFKTCGYHKSQEPQPPVVEHIAESIPIIEASSDAESQQSVDEFADIDNLFVNDGMFSAIFDAADGYKPNCPMSLSDTKFTELIDANKLAFIANNKDNIFKNLRESARDAVDFEELWMATHGKNKFAVEYVQDVELLGRYQARGAKSGQGLLREARHTVYDKFYYDIDVVNAHPVIISWLCENLEIESEYLNEYVSNREEQLAKLMGINSGMSRDKAKQIFLSIQYGGSADFNGVVSKTRFLVDYKNELEEISKQICEKMSYFKEVSDKRAESSGKTFNLLGRALSHICCYVENQLLMAMYGKIKSKFVDAQSCVLCFDGIMLPKKLVSSEDVNSFCSEITDLFADWRVPIVVKSKPMQPIDLSLFGYDEGLYYSCKGAYYPFDLSAFYQFDVDQKYSEMMAKPKATEFNVLHKLLAKLIELLPRELIRFKDDARFSEADSKFRDIKSVALWFRKCFAVIKYSDGIIVVKERNATGSIVFATKKLSSVTSFSITDVKFNYGSDLKSIFIPVAIGYATSSLSYDCITATPHDPKNRFEGMSPELGFSLAPSHIHDYDPEFKVDMAIVDVWLNHMKEVICDGDEALFNYLLRWFAHILAKPRVKTGVVPLVKSAPGCGKNVFVTVFTDYILNSNLTIVTSDAEKIASRFNGIAEGKIFLCLDEAVDSWNRALNNKMKNFITEPTRTIEKKGLESYTVSDYSNYMYTTNNDFASIIEEGDRRYVCIRANSKYKGNSKYFDNFVSKLHNIDAGRHLFHYLLSLDLSNFDVRKIPQTDYKRELAFKQASSAVEFLIALRQRILVDANTEDSASINSDDGFGFSDFSEWIEYKKVPSSELYRIYVDWCESARAKILSQKSFSSSLRDSGIESKRTKHCVEYSISPELIESALSADYDLS